MRLSYAKSLFVIFVAACLITIVYKICTGENLEVLEAWNYNKTRNVSVYILPQEDTTIHIPNGFCNNDLFLLVIIYSAPGNFAARKAIRETWAAQKEVLNYFIEFYFLIGRSNDADVQGQLDEEYLMYDDIVQEDFLEGYYNLSLKSIFMLKNVQRYCLGKAEYLLKIDDDMYLNVKNLVNTLLVSDRSDLVMGRLFHHTRAIRFGRSKWYAPHYLYEEDYYPPFVSGTGYVMSIDMVHKLFSASLSRPLYHLEDVYVTGILSKDVGVEPRDNTLFSHLKVYFSACTYINLITSHGYTHAQLRWLFRKISESNLKELCANRCRYSVLTNCVM